jgi:hypothetical protein
VHEALPFVDIKLAPQQRFFRSLALRDVDHGPYEFNEIARSVENRMAYAVNLADTFVWMNDTVVQVEIYLVADAFLDSFPASGLIVRMNALNDGF